MEGHRDGGSEEEVHISPRKIEPRGVKVFKKDVKKLSLKEYQNLTQENLSLRKRSEQAEQLVVEMTKTLNQYQADFSSLLSSNQELMAKFNRMCMLWVRTTGQKNIEPSEHLESVCACLAASRGDVEALRNIVSNQGSVTKKSIEGRTALHEAAAEGHYECVKFLLESGVPINVRDYMNRTPLQEAINKKNTEIAELIEKTWTGQVKKNLTILQTSGDEPIAKRKWKWNKPTPSPALSSLHSSGHTSESSLEYIQQAPGLPSSPSPSTKPSSLNSTKKKSNDSLLLKGLKKRHNKKSSPNVTVPSGVAFGVYRGICHGVTQGKHCECTFYQDSGKGPCVCSHFASSHENLGIADTHDDHEHDHEHELPLESLLVPKLPDKEWPKVLNLNCKPDDHLMEFGKYLLCDLSKWIIQADEIEFLSEIGQGTSATVYKGKYESQTVAIKVVNLEEKNADKQLNDLKMEFEVMTAFLNLHFSHQDYFVKLFGIVSTPRLCLVMQYCGRGSLFHLLHKPDFELTWPLLFCWMKEITSGIHALHSLKPPIVHRDIKTLNLLVTDNFEIRIADFGLSRFLRRTNSGNYATLTKLRGTYCYSAPELYKGTPYTTKSDVYSLSIVLWELATKCVTGIYTQPYSEFSFINFDFQIIIQVAKKGIRPSIAPTIPSEVSDIIKLLWSDDPEQRPDTEILLEMLESAENKYKKENLEWDALRQSESHSIPVTQSVPSVPVLNFEHISSSGNISGPSTPTTSSLPVSPFLKMSDTTISKKETKFNHLSKKLESHFPSTPKPKHTRTHPTLSLSATTSPMQKRKFS